MNVGTRTFFITALLISSLGVYAQTDSAKTGNIELANTTTTPSSLSSAIQKKDEKKQSSLIISADVRIRTELRHGYRNVAIKDTTPAFFVNQRSRINFDFKTKRFDFFASLQDARVWGQQDPREGQGTTSSVTANPTSTFPVYFFELYAEPHFNDNWSVRIGRQRINYDNLRLFAESDWRLAGASHDAIRFIYTNKTNLNTELLGAYNQSSENTFGSNYIPNGFKNYKNLLVHYLNWKINKTITLTTLNTMDGYQSAVHAATSYQRLTSGGRLEYTANKWYASFSGYYQYGKDSSGRKLSAYYIQPEIKYSAKNISVRLGMELLSGQDTNQVTDNNFVPLYGVAHRFNGNLDLFTLYPSDTKNSGLINPYLHFQYQKNKTSVRVENHLFYAQTGAAFKTLPHNNKYLGFENDWRINYKINAFTDFEFGFCWAAVTPSLVEMRNNVKTEADISKYSQLPYWTYASIRFTPVIGKFSF